MQKKTSGVHRKPTKVTTSSSLKICPNPSSKKHVSVLYHLHHSPLPKAPQSLPLFTLDCLFRLASQSKPLLAVSWTQRQIRTRTSTTPPLPYSAVISIASTLPKQSSAAILVFPLPSSSPQWPHTLAPRPSLKSPKNGVSSSLLSLAARSIQDICSVDEKTQCS